MRFRGGEFSTGTMGNFQPELTKEKSCAGGIAQVVEKKSGCATGVWAFPAEKAGRVPSPRSAEHASDAVAPPLVCFCNDMIPQSLRSGGR